MSSTVSGHGCQSLPPCWFLRISILNFFPRVEIFPAMPHLHLRRRQGSVYVKKESVVGATFLKGNKGKLTVYFKQDEGGEHNGDGEGRSEGEDDAVELSKEWPENCGKFVEIERKGETGWYRYQDKEDY
ncbi:hypothetical protein HAX54_039621 [Datura stramonium]|uniref:Uncharacterized protein n=1 Tax=Datura stramonium TaxID=4076 RepID=A0ABS8SK75_DATST|nr:hypothetical protein [Datura stramonium]